MGLAGAGAANVSSMARTICQGRYEQVQGWVKLYMSMLEALSYSTMSFAYIPYMSSINPYAHNSAMEHWALVYGISCMHIIAIYILASIVGIGGKFDERIAAAVNLYAHGLSAENTAALGCERFLGCPKQGAMCETMTGDTLRISTSIHVEGKQHLFLSDPNKDSSLGVAARSSQLIGQGMSQAPATAVRVLGPNIGAIKADLTAMACGSSDRVFNRKIAALMTRFSALTSEMKDLPDLKSEDLNATSNLSIGWLSRYGFPAVVQARVVFNDPRWPTTFAVAFWNVADRWMVLAFHGDDLTDLARSMSSVCPYSEPLKDGGHVQADVWRSLCGTIEMETPYYKIGSALVHIRNKYWTSTRADSKPTLTITGSGFGGSIAELFYFLKVGTPGHFAHRPISAYTFGAFGVGDKAYKKEVTVRSAKLDAVLFSVRNNLDLAALLPVGMSSAGQNVTLHYPAPSTVGTCRSSLPLLASDIVSWFEQFRASYKNSMMICRSTTGDSTSVVLASLFWFMWSPPLPFVHDHRPISYFNNLDGNGTAVMESNTFDSTPRDKKSN